ncbi:hypothetical protein BDF20DRAFT_33817 [Mycotypha africana]|uniref:uncharacterized protein n=1 Tax=Mycotypha africana TaxID=64632 RepID=UPI002301C75F|nr:uncharacterized protein BDF20DRAFT_33817 [Mycotypha africana]KAI8991292.1 hypothetical protein BDF20DRAFT_33817 [Mycotypha africana]
MIAVGVTPHMEMDRVNGYRDVMVWDGITDAHSHFDGALLNHYPSNNPNRMNVEPNTVAYMVENINIQSAALKRLEECSSKEGSQIDLFDKTKVTKIVRPLIEELHQHYVDGENKAVPKDKEVKAESPIDLEDWPSIHLDNGKTIKTRLLIGADGINSPVRDFAYIDSLGWDYDTHGVVATLKLDPNRPNNTAWQRFLPSGPIALLPLSEEYASLVWSVKPHLAKALKNVSPADFCTLINAAYRLPHVDLQYMYKQISSSPSPDMPSTTLQDEYAWRENTATKSLSDQSMLDREYALPPQVIDVQENSRASFPFRLRNAERYVADRVALVGDAAHSTHPLAGQGMNQGLLDVECLSKLLEKGTMEGQDIGNIHLLRKYPAERYWRNILMLSSCDKIDRLFSNDIAPVTWIRSLGIKAVHNMDFLKAEIMKYAMGIEYSGDFRH